MKITYDVPTIPKNTGSVKYKKEYDKVFYFYHSKDKEMMLEVEDSKKFIRCTYDTTITPYRERLRFIRYDDTKVLIVKK